MAVLSFIGWTFTIVIIGRIAVCLLRDQAPSHIDCGLLGIIGTAFALSVDHALYAAANALFTGWQFASACKDYTQRHIVKVRVYYDDASGEWRPHPSEGP